MGPTRGPPGSCPPQVDPMLAPWTLLSGWIRGRNTLNFIAYGTAPNFTQGPLDINFRYQYKHCRRQRMLFRSFFLRTPLKQREFWYAKSSTTLLSSSDAVDTITSIPPTRTNKWYDYNIDCHRLIQQIDNTWNGIKMIIEWPYSIGNNILLWTRPQNWKLWAIYKFKMRRYS